MYTNTMRFTGLSGIDTQSMVEQLMKAESIKLTRLQKNTEYLTWKQDAYRNTASTLNKFQKDFLTFGSGTNFRSTATFKNFSNTLKLNGAQTSAVTITSSSAASAGKNTLKIDQLASTEIYKSSQFSGSVTSTADVMVQNLKSGDSFNIALDNITKTITLTDDDILNMNSGANDIEKTQNLSNILNEKLKNIFGQENNQNKVSVSASNGKLEFLPLLGHEILITEGTVRNTSKTAIQDYVEPSSDTTYTFDVTTKSGIKNISLDVPASTSSADFVKLLNQKLIESDASALKVSLDNNKIVFSNPNSSDHISITGTDFLNFVGFGADVTIENTNVLADLKIAPSSSSKINLSKNLEETFGVLGNLNFSINNVDFSISSTDSIKTFIDKINNSTAGVKLVVDNLNQTFKLESTSTGASNAINIIDSNNLFSTLGFSKVQDAQDAIFSFNGVQTSRPTNNVDLGGLKLQLNEVTSDEIEIALENDNTQTLESIKSFIENYNSVIEHINTQTKTTRNRSNGRVSYEPLTPDEKKAMSENEIKLWEDKAKEGILYRDDILKNISTNLRSFLYESVELSGGGKLSLYEIGITTSTNYSDGGKLIIDEEKLLSALDARGDDIVELFTKSSSIPYTDKANFGKRMREQGIADRINDIINNSIGPQGSISKKAGLKNTLSESKNDIYEQLQINATKISSMLDYLYKKETHYFAMFSKMEASINQSNSQMSYLSSMFI